MFSVTGVVQQPVQDGGGDDAVAKHLAQAPNLWLRAGSLARARSGG